MLLQIESVKLSKSGKSYWVVSSTGEGYSSKALGIEQTAGKTIDAVTNVFKIGNDDVNGIQSFTVVAGSPTGYAPPVGGHAPPISMPVAGPSAMMGGAAAQYNDRFWLPFVSNQVAHAIAAGLIKEPGDMDRWAKAAYSAINNADDIAF